MKTKTDELLALACKAATERWPDDRLAPGIQIAHVKKTGGNYVFYVALHRYPQTSQTRSLFLERQIEAKTEHEDLDEAIKTIALAIVPLPPPIDAQQDLAEALGVKV